MARTATEAPAAYLLGCQFYDRVAEILENVLIDEDHNDMAVLLIKYSERILGNLGAAELRWMLSKPTAIEPAHFPGRWLVHCHHAGRRWTVVVEPEGRSKILLGITVFQRSP